jgi:hypothetical protein
VARSAFTRKDADDGFLTATGAQEQGPVDGVKRWASVGVGGIPREERGSGAEHRHRLTEPLSKAPARVRELVARYRVSPPVWMTTPKPLPTKS